MVGGRQGSRLAGGLKGPGTARVVGLSTRRGALSGLSDTVIDLNPPVIG